MVLSSCFAKLPIQYGRRICAGNRYQEHGKVITSQLRTSVHSFSFRNYVRVILSNRWHAQTRPRCSCAVSSLKPKPNCRNFADDIFKCIFVNENILISLKISLKFIPKVRINNIPSLVQIIAWHRPGDKPLSEPMMVSSFTHICVTRPQWHKYVYSIVILSTNLTQHPIYLSREWHKWRGVFFEYKAWSVSSTCCYSIYRWVSARKT